MDRCGTVTDTTSTPSSCHQTKKERSPGNDTEEGDQKTATPGEAHPGMDPRGRGTSGRREIQSETRAGGKKQGTGTGGETNQEG